MTFLLKWSQLGFLYEKKSPEAFCRWNSSAVDLVQQRGRSALGRAECDDLSGENLKLAEENKKVGLLSEMC